jgi:hypothetical protein
MPDWLVIFFPLLAFAVLFPLILIYEYRRARKKKRAREES